MTREQNACLSPLLQAEQWTPAAAEGCPLGLEIPAEKNAGQRMSTSTQAVSLLHLLQ